MLGILWAFLFLYWQFDCGTSDCGISGNDFYISYKRHIAFYTRIFAEGTLNLVLDDFFRRWSSKDTCDTAIPLFFDFHFLMKRIDNSLIINNIVIVEEFQQIIYK